jgi:hypothetical protein
VRSDRNTKAEPGFIKRRNRIRGIFTTHNRNAGISSVPSTQSIGPSHFPDHLTRAKDALAAMRGRE